MHNHGPLPSKPWPTVVVLAGLAFGAIRLSASGQAPGVPIIRDRGEPSAALIEKANRCRKAGELLSLDDVRRQLSRTNAVLKLPRPSRRELSDVEIWRLTRAAHVQVGWHYLCTKCEHWHQNLAGGYYLTPDGVVATCYHVLRPEKHTNMREGYLVAANEAGDLMPVREVLAASELTDAALLRLKPRSPVPCLALNTNVTPGEAAWCYSDPLGRKNYFSTGMVNRFYYHPRQEREIIRLEVSTDWAPGSSGAAIVDRCGNAIGHVSEVFSGGARNPPSTNQTGRASAPVIVFHSGTRAADVQALVIAPGKQKR